MKPEIEKKLVENSCLQVFYTLFVGSCFISFLVLQSTEPPLLKAVLLLIVMIVSILGTFYYYKDIKEVELAYCKR